LNSRLNFRLVISTLRFMGHDLIFVSTKPAAAQTILLEHEHIKRRTIQQRRLMHHQKAA
jgi:hypothetical protein